MTLQVDSNLCLVPSQVAPEKLNFQQVGPSALDNNLSFSSRLFPPAVVFFFSPISSELLESSHFAVHKHRLLEPYAGAVAAVVLLVAGFKAKANENMSFSKTQEDHVRKLFN